MKLATWNVNSLNVRLPRLVDWLGATRPDVVCLQETKLVDAKFPRMELAAAGYASHFVGQNTYNGVALLVRDGVGPVDDVVTALPDFADEQKRVIAATVAGMRIVDFYVPNGQSVDSDKYRYKLDWCRAATAFLAGELAPARRRSRSPAISTSRRRTATSTTPSSGAGRCCAPTPNARCSATGSALGMRDSFRLFDAAGEDVQLVGLPAARVSEEPRLAHRPHPARAGARGALHVLPHRPQRAQGREARPITRR